MVYLAFKVTGSQKAEEKNTLGQQDYAWVAPAHF